MSLSSVVLPYLTDIGDGAFKNDIHISSFNPPTLNWAYSIGNSAFMSCTSLTSIANISSLTSIGNNAFADCVKLKKIVFPYVYNRYNLNEWYVDVISNGVFENCSSLRSIEFGNAMAGISSTAFSTCATGLSIVFQKNFLTDFFDSTDIAALACSSSKLGSPKQTAVAFTLDNGCSYPMAYAINASEIYIVKSPALIVNFSPTRRTLSCINSSYEPIVLPATSFVGLTEICSNAFSKTTTLEKVHFLES